MKCVRPPAANDDGLLKTPKGSPMYKNPSDIQTEPLVSIVVRTCQRPFLLNRALQSILEQTYKNIEIIVIDDGRHKINADFTTNVSRDFQIHYICSAMAGRSAAGNIGIAQARGDFVIFLDDDDELYPPHVALLVSKILEQKKLEPETIVYSDCELSYESYDAGCDRLTEDRKQVRFSYDYSQSLLLVRNYIPLMCICFPRALLERTGGFDESLDLFEDWDLLLNLSFGSDFVHIPEVTAKYRIWSRDQRSQEPEDIEISYVKVVSKYMSQIKPENLYELFQFTEKIIELTVSIHGKDRELEKKDRELEKMGAKNEQLLKLYGDLTKKDETISNLQRTIAAMTEENRKLFFQNDELQKINQMYIEENMRKESHIAKISICTQESSA